MVATLDYISPQTVEQGAQDQQVTIKGSGLLGSIAVTCSGTGVATSNIQVPDDETVVFDISVMRYATIGLRDVSVTLADASVVTWAEILAVTNFQSLLSQLRLLVGERIARDESDTDTFFSDDELTDMVIRHSGNLYLAAGEAWAAKAADRADLIDITESGSERKQNQFFTNALKMQSLYVTAGNSIAQTLIEPVVAQVASVLGPGLGRPTRSSRPPEVDPVFDPIYNDPFLFLNAQRSWPVLELLYLT